MRNKVLCKIPAAERDQMKELIQVSQPLLKLIRRLYSEDIQKLVGSDEEDFDCPSWALKRAYKDGLIKGLTKLDEYVIIDE
jgi:hypothetical protein